MTQQCCNRSTPPGDFRPLALDAPRHAGRMHPLGRAGKADLLGRYSRPPLHRYDPATGRDDAMPLAQEMGCFALAGAVFIYGMRSALRRLDRFGGEFTPWTSPDYDPARARFNDGRCDGWVASGPAPCGSHGTGRGGIVYRLDADGRLARSATRSSSPTASPFRAGRSQRDLADTAPTTCSGPSTTTSPPASRPIAACCAAAMLRAGGRPDGACVDAEGNVCAAMMAGGRVRKFHRRANCSR